MVTIDLLWYSYDSHFGRMMSIENKLVKQMVSQHNYYTNLWYSKPYGSLMNIPH